MQTKEQNIKLELFPPLPHLHLGIFLLYVALFVHLLCAVLLLSPQPHTFFVSPSLLGMSDYACTSKYNRSATGPETSWHGTARTQALV